MAALIKKDLYVLGNQFWVLVVTALIASFIPQLENLASSYLATLVMTIPLSVLFCDERCHWDTYLSMTPCPPERAVFSKYLFIAGLTAAAGVLILLAGCVQTAVSGEDYNLMEMLAARLSPLVVSLAVNAVTLPTAFRFGVGKGQLTMIVLLSGVMAVIIGGAHFAGISEMFRWVKRSIAGITVSTAAAFLLSFFLSVRFYKKRRSGSYR